MASSPTFDLFPIDDLNKVCFLAVTEQLDNTGRRHLSQTCQRFRRLLVPDDRYSNPPDSYWDEISVDNPFSFAQHHRKVLNSQDTRLVCALDIEELWSIRKDIEDLWSRDGFCIHWYVGDLDRVIRVYESKAGEQPTDGLHLDNGCIPKNIIGRLPAVLYKTLYELSKYFTFERLHLDIISERSIRLPLILSSSLMFQSTLIRVLCLLRTYEETVSDEAIEILIDDFRNGMTMKTLALKSGDRNALPTLRKLKALIQKNHSDILYEVSTQPCPVMTSSPTFALFPLYDLNKVCFLAVAEQLDNDGRRYLSQTCQRFRRLLVPEDRYSNPPESYWDKISVDNPFSFAQHHRKVPNSLETRHVCSLEVSDSAIMQSFWKTQSFEITLSVADLQRWITVKEQEDRLPPTGVRLDDGRIRKYIIGRMPAVLYETLHELSKNIVVEDLNIRIEQGSSKRLPLMLSSSSMFQSIPIRVVCLLFEGTVSDEALGILIDDFRIGKSMRLELLFIDGNRDPICALRKLKALTQQNHNDIEWKETSNMDGYLLKLSKENGRLVVHIDNKYSKELG